MMQHVCVISPKIPHNLNPWKIPARPKIASFVWLKMRKKVHITADRKSITTGQMMEPFLVYKAAIYRNCI